MKKLLISIIAVCIAGFAFSSYSAADEILKQAEEYRDTGYRYQRQGNFRKALNNYQKAVQLYPDFKEVYNDIGVIYERQAKLSQAEQMYLKALDIDSNYPAPYANLGFLYEKKRDYQKAVYYWHRRYDLGPDGSYWKDKARERLIALDSYLPFKKEELDKKVASLSRELEEEREQRRSQASRL
jgi:tetratricopeptide (TPR) repeat protein